MPPEDCLLEEGRRVGDTQQFTELRAEDKTA